MMGTYNDTWWENVGDTQNRILIGRFYILIQGCSICIWAVGSSPVDLGLGWFRYIQCLVFWRIRGKPQTIHQIVSIFSFKIMTIFGIPHFQTVTNDVMGIDESIQNMGNWSWKWGVNHQAWGFYHQISEIAVTFKSWGQTMNNYDLAINKRQSGCNHQNWDWICKDLLFSKSEVPRDTGKSDTPKPCLRFYEQFWINQPIESNRDINQPLDVMRPNHNLWAEVRTGTSFYTRVFLKWCFAAFGFLWPRFSQWCTGKSKLKSLIWG